MQSRLPGYSDALVKGFGLADLENSVLWNNLNSMLTGWKRDPDYLREQ